VSRIGASRASFHRIIVTGRRMLRHGLRSLDGRGRQAQHIHHTARQGRLAKQRGQMEGLSMTLPPDTITKRLSRALRQVEWHPSRGSRISAAARSETRWPTQGG
jgi:hypothetical protein